VGESEQAGIPGEEPSGLPGPAEEGVSAGSPSGEQPSEEASSGAWSPEVEAAVTKMRQADRAELEARLREERSRRDEEIAAVRAEQRELRNAAPQQEAPGLDRVDRPLLDEALKASPAFKGLMEQNRMLRQQVRDSAIEGGLDLLRDEPFFNEVREDVARDLRAIPIGDGPGLNRRSVGMAFKERVHDRLKKELASAQADLQAARDEKRAAMEAAIPGGAGSTAGAPVVDLSAMSTEDLKARVDGMSDEEVGQLFGRDRD